MNSFTKKIENLINKKTIIPNFINFWSKIFNFLIELFPIYDKIYVCLMFELLRRNFKN